MTSLADVFRWHGLSEHGRATFLQAATVLLELDPDTRRLPRRQRSQLLHPDTYERGAQRRLPVRLRSAVVALVEEMHDNPPGASDVAGELGRRILAAYVVARVLHGVADEPALDRATAFLFALQREAAAERHRSNGSNGQEQRSGTNVRQHAAEMKKLASAAERLRAECPELKTQSKRARALLREGFRAPNPKALMDQARRAGIEI